MKKIIQSITVQFIGPPHFVTVKRFTRYPRHYKRVTQASVIRIHHAVLGRSVYYHLIS